MVAQYEESKVTYQQIVMRQITKIQDISCKELRDGTKTIKNLIGEQLIEGEDTRHSFLQAVELLGSLLSPYFNTTVTGEFEEFCDLYDMELIEAIKDKDFKELVCKVFQIKEQNKIENKIELDDNIREQVNTFFLNYKIKEGRKMFRSLVKLFKQNDFLANESYGEGAGTEDQGLDAVDEELEGAMDA